MTQSNPTQSTVIRYNFLNHYLFSDSTQPTITVKKSDPIQPKPRVDPTHGHLCRHSASSNQVSGIESDTGTSTFTGKNSPSAHPRNRFALAIYHRPPQKNHNDFTQISRPVPTRMGARAPCGFRGCANAPPPLKYSTTVVDF